MEWENYNLYYNNRSGRKLLLRLFFSLNQIVIGDMKALL